MMLARRDAVANLKRRAPAPPQGVSVPNKPMVPTATGVLWIARPARGGSTSASR